MARKKKKPTASPEMESQTPEAEPIPVAQEGAPSEETKGAGPQEGAPSEETKGAGPQETVPETEEAARPQEEAPIPEELAARVADLEEQLATARQEAQEYLDGWTRERAAFANYKKRIAEQQEALRQELLAEVIKDFLEVLDDLELALNNRPEDEPGATWAEGIALIARKLQQKLAAKGVEPVPAEPGQPFDPRYHEAVSHEPVDGTESGHIIAVVRAGYRIGDRVIRPALVRVAQ